MAFHVGQRIMAIGGMSVGNATDLKTELVVGGIYTVRSIASEYLPRYGMVGIRVEEYIVPAYPFMGRPFEPATLCCYFRPLIEHKTDISAFTALLNPANHRHLEDV